MLKPLIRASVLKNQNRNRLRMEMDMSTEQEMENPEFELRGINHLALVCSDMDRTVEFYRDVLGMPLIGDIELPDGIGHHFFFDIGKGVLAFFWFAKAPEAAPGVASPRRIFGDSKDRNDSITAHASMNHVAFDVPEERFDEYYQRLQAKGIRTSAIYNHDESPRQYSETITETTFGRSVYFMDPDGILLEFATWIRPLHGTRYASAVTSPVQGSQPAAAPDPSNTAS
jgi:catechol 2,3-dioxygenase-like lactoylglutathione lyase family enzyme